MDGMDYTIEHPVVPDNTNAQQSPRLDHANGPIYSSSTSQPSSSNMMDIDDAPRAVMVRMQEFFNTPEMLARVAAADAADAADAAEAARAGLMPSFNVSFPGSICSFDHHFGLTLMTISSFWGSHNLQCIFTPRIVTALVHGHPVATTALSAHVIGNKHIVVYQTRTIRTLTNGSSRCTTSSNRQ